MLKVMSYNTLFGGYDRDDATRFDLQVDAVLSADPDILMVQEWKEFLSDGGQRIFDAERKLKRRALIAAAPGTGQNTAILVKPDMVICSFEVDNGHFHHAAAIATLQVPGLPTPLTAVSVHLCPNGPDIRIREVSYLAGIVGGIPNVVIGGDFNSISPHDPEPALSELAPHHRVRYADDQGNAHRLTLSRLEQAGLVDLAVKLNQNHIPTVPGDAFKDREFVPFRCDYLLSSRSLSELAIEYSVLNDPLSLGRASDHYPIMVAFDLPADRKSVV